eukprot:NODE_26014_length_567_cov_8.163636.p1 GENE.NODE_26014_length_567_cov_8.163636~~NODE_26014_length_567_cov_8.163636.p1  ORF type:complete len:128 (-),score=15.97 NODE_26014_length_567_cov_8.163636:84-467(-)
MFVRRGLVSPQQAVWARCFSARYMTPKPKTFRPAFVKGADMQGSWCSCGLSKDGTWCDGSHNKTDMKPMGYDDSDIVLNKWYLICRCKHTSTPPYCDHTHIKVAATEWGLGFATSKPVPTCQQNLDK